jgi:high-affinity iron transporter
MVYYLGFKFLGSGIHALQVSGLFASTSIPGLPAVPFLGFYPSWETAGPQVLLLLAAVVAFLYLHSQEQRAEKVRAPATS